METLIFCSRFHIPEASSTSSLICVWIQGTNVNTAECSDYKFCICEKMVNPAGIGQKGLSDRWQGTVLYKEMHPGFCDTETSSAQWFLTKTDPISSLHDCGKMLENVTRVEPRSSKSRRQLQTFKIYLLTRILILQIFMPGVGNTGH